MKKITLFILFVAFTPHLTLAQSTPEKTRMSDQLTMGVLWFQQSAEMQIAYEQAYRYAQLLLDQKLATRRSEKPAAVVLDLDETVLDNSPYEVFLIDNGLTYGDKSWSEWTAEARADLLPGAKAFIAYAKEKGVEVFYISNRSVADLEVTIKNLKAHGLPNASADFVMLKDKTSDKTPRRQAVKKDYDILVFIGDNLTDYSEDFADRGEDMGKGIALEKKDEVLSNFVMLPNPMYGEWEKAIYKNDYSQSDSVKLELRNKALVR